MNSTKIQITLSNGLYRVYGVFSAVMNVKPSGEIVYSNLHADATEYQRMKKAVEEQLGHGCFDNQTLAHFKA
jgi:hypothetical protein